MITDRDKLNRAITFANEYRIGLFLHVVGCGKQKADSARPASELYTGDLTAKRLRIVERFVDPALILSGEHGLVGPTAVIEPYDTCCTRKAQVEILAARVARQLDALGAERITISLHAGAKYQRIMERAAELAATPIRVVPAPIQGEVGEQKQGYKAWAGMVDRAARLDRELWEAS